MVVTRVCAVLFVAFVGAVDAGRTLRKRSSYDAEKTKFTVNDKIMVNGAVFAEGAAIGDHVGCSEYPAGTSDFGVCGCGAKVVAPLLTECQPYKKYDVTVGACDCGVSGCATKTLTTGYSSPFSWKAYSFEVVPC